MTEYNNTLHLGSVLYPKSMSIVQTFSQALHCYCRSCHIQFTE